MVLERRDGRLNLSSLESAAIKATILPPSSHAHKIAFHHNYGHIIQ